MKTYVLVTIETREIVETRDIKAATDTEAIDILAAEENDDDEEEVENWRRYELRDGQRLVAAW